MSYTNPKPSKIDFTFYPYTVPDADAVNFKIIHDQKYEGIGYFSGNIKKNNVSSQAIVRVFDNNNKILIRELLTDEFGNYNIQFLNEYYKYDIIAYDPESNWESKIYTNKLPAI